MTKNEQIAVELRAFAAGIRKLPELSKDALVCLHREEFKFAGDYARTSKSEYLDKVQSVTGAKALAAADRLSTQQPTTQQPTPTAPAFNLSMKPTTPDIFNAISREPQAMNAPAPAAVAAVVPEQAADQLTALIASIAAANAPKAQDIDEAAVLRLIRQEVGSLRPLQINLTNGNSVTLPAEHRHPAFQDVLDCAAAGLNVLLVGPAGSGKTHLAEQVSRALGREYGSLHCTAGASESQLMGWLLPTGENGRFEYQPAPFVILYEQGNSVFLLDEIDAADPNMLLCINGALANGHLHIPQRLGHPIAKRGDDVAIIAAANTFGTGQDFVYSGRNQLDAATLDRFVTIWIDYDRELERAMLEDGDLLGWIWSVREKLASFKIRRVISTRAVQKAGKLAAAGWSLDKVKKTVLAGWTRDELNRIGE